jgi:DNA ligase (NAD+)
MNASCPARIKQSIRHFVSKGGLDVDGIGPKLIDQLVDRGLVRRLGDLFRLDPHSLTSLDRMGPTSAGNLLDALERAKRVSLPRFLFALGIPEVGERTAEILAERFGSLEVLSRATEEELTSIRDIGPRTAEAIVQFFGGEENRAMLADLQDVGLSVESLSPERLSDAPLGGRTFVFTGTLDSMTRAEAGARVKSLGATVSGTVGRRTDYVVVGADPGAKAEKARQAGVPILTEAEFLELLASHE